MEIKPIITHHFVKSEDLNHHGTLYAGRTAEWFVETGLMAVAAYIPPENIVCAQIHGINFTRPVKLGETVEFIGKAVYTGRTSMIANIRVLLHGAEILNGFITFVNVDHEGHSFLHGIILEPVSEEDVALHEAAKHLRSTGAKA